MLEELLVEDSDSLEHLLHQFNWWEDGGAEVEGSFLLSETAAWDDADTCVLEELMDIEEVGGLAEGLKPCDE